MKNIFLSFLVIGIVVFVLFILYSIIVIAANPLSFQTPLGDIDYSMVLFWGVFMVAIVMLIICIVFAALTAWTYNKYTLELGCVV
jgi:ABC-type Fe3+ transport system permease subunit